MISLSGTQNSLLSNFTNKKVSVPSLMVLLHLRIFNLSMFLTRMALVSGIASSLLSTPMPLNSLSIIFIYTMNFRSFPRIFAMGFRSLTILPPSFVMTSYPVSNMNPPPMTLRLYLITSRRRWRRLG